MEKQNGSCCCCDELGSEENCILCGRPLVYFQHTRMMECRICRQMKPANAACEDGHFVCDACHSAGGVSILDRLVHTRERDPIRLYLDCCGMKGVHLHGPEHHSIIPCVLVAAFHSNGGDIELEECLREAWDRGRRVPGGACGFLGVCGAAAGAGIFASIVAESSPLSAEVWHIPQRLTALCLEKITEIGGPRCCKRTGRIAIETAAEYSGEVFGVKMQFSRPACTYSGRNRECLKTRCPFFKAADGPDREPPAGRTADLT